MNGLSSGLISKLFRLSGSGWAIGPGRARQLADYALAQFDAQLKPLKNAFAASWNKVDKEVSDMRSNLGSVILSWEDESFGPESGLGTPFSEMGPGSKARYTSYIDNWVRGLIERIMWDLNGESHDAFAGTGYAGAEKGPARLTPGGGAWSMLSRAGGIPTGAVSLQQQIVENAAFIKQADTIADQYPSVIYSLRKQFIKDAFALVATQGADRALTTLRGKFESIQRAGQAKQGK